MVCGRACGGSWSELVVVVSGEIRAHSAAFSGGQKKVSRILDRVNVPVKVAPPADENDEFPTAGESKSPRRASDGDEKKVVDRVNKAL